ncbi:MAG: type I-E CRISPR-associated endonuclease Cas1e [Micrococcales bacterium]|nr:type I-E CRISPR-associated endonuclease Cas1e [Micrococcales bacterium]
MAAQSLARAQDRLTFLYLERCTISRDSGAITATDANGTVSVPGAMLGALLLGPGTRVTHRAMQLIAECGATVVWVGEAGVRYYAHGRSLARSSDLLYAQAALVSNPRSRVAVARKMYGLRFPDEDVSRMKMEQLRGREGARVRRAYRAESRRTGVPWGGRRYDREDFSSADLVNQALSAATICLYGISHAAIVALGASPALGFIHHRDERSFVYDIADLYKAELAIPTAFDAAALGVSDVMGYVRRTMRDRMVHERILERCVADIRYLLTGDAIEVDEDPDASPLVLWDAQHGEVAGGVSYVSRDEDGDDR